MGIARQPISGTQPIARQPISGGAMRWMLAAAAASAHAAAKAKRCEEHLAKICDCATGRCRCGAVLAGHKGCCNMNCGECDELCGAQYAVDRETPPQGYEPAPMTAPGAAACASRQSCGACVADAACAWCVSQRACRENVAYECQGEEDHAEAPREAREAATPRVDAPSDATATNASEACADDDAGARRPPAPEARGAGGELRPARRGDAAKRPYDVLGVDVRRPIRKAYRTLSLRFHPDKNPGLEALATDAFEAIAAAFALLSAPDARMKFDDFGESGEDSFDSFSTQWEWEAYGDAKQKDQTFYGRDPFIANLDGEASWTRRLGANRGTVWVVEFYAPWRRRGGLEAAWEAVEFGAVNCARNAKICNDWYGIRAYPTVLALNEVLGTRTEFFGDKTEDALLDWVGKVADEWRFLASAADVKLIADADDYRAAILNATRFAVVAFSDGLDCVACKTARTNLLRLSAAGDADSRPLVAFVDCDAPALARLCYDDGDECEGTRRSATACRRRPTRPSSRPSPRAAQGPRQPERGLALCFALAAAFVAPRTAVVVSPSRLSAAPSRRSAAPRRRSSARFASDDGDDVDFEAAFKARVADDGGALGVKAKVLKNEAGRTASSVASSARDATRSSGQKVAKGLGLEPLTRRESAGTAAEEADLLTAGGWARRLDVRMATDAASTAAAVALFPQALVPIVVDLDVRGVRYVDSFLWTTGASCMTPEAYAAQTCDDLDLSVEMGHMLADAVRAQVAHALTLIAHAAARERAGRPLLPGAVVLVVDVTNGGKRFCDEFRWDTRARAHAPGARAAHATTWACPRPSTWPSPSLRASSSARRGAVAAESSATPQRTQPMPGARTRGTGGRAPRARRAPPEPGRACRAARAASASASAAGRRRAGRAHRPPGGPVGLHRLRGGDAAAEPGDPPGPQRHRHMRSGWANLPPRSDRYRAAPARRAQAPRAA
ncbi:hypothetical protein JL722_9699 [Aureococcus anophagefferens]|nr:hypothetical protein JL722_9699 [Aureococcus anophagefferens]